MGVGGWRLRRRGCSPLALEIQTKRCREREIETPSPSRASTPPACPHACTYALTNAPQHPLHLVIPFRLPQAHGQFRTPSSARPLSVTRRGNSPAHPLAGHHAHTAPLHWQHPPRAPRSRWQPFPAPRGCPPSFRRATRNSSWKDPVSSLRLRDACRRPAAARRVLGGTLARGAGGSALW